MANILQDVNWNNLSSKEKRELKAISDAHTNSKYKDWKEYITYFEYNLIGSLHYYNTHPNFI